MADWLHAPHLPPKLYGPLLVPRAGRGPSEGDYPIDTGTCRLVRDGDNPNGWLLLVNGVHSSHIDLLDPTQLDFDYMRWMARLIEGQWAPDARLRMLHLGGGACSLPRWAAAAYPQARQVVVELDGRLAELVREWFELPRAPLLRIRAGEARAVTETLTESSRDVIIRDVFAGNTTPRPLTTREFAEQAARVLAHDGMYVVNCGSPPDLRPARSEAATIASVFPHTVIIADPPMLKGRRYGNVVIAGSRVALGQGAALPRQLLAGAVPAQVWHTEQVRRFAAGAEILVDAADTSH